MRVNEKTRIARDLHDTLLQSFHGLLLRFQTAMDLLPSRATEAKQVLGSAIDQAAEAITEGRDPVQGLRSSTVETNDLADAIRTVGEELAADEGANHGVVLRVEAQGGPRPLHPIVRDEIPRIAGEALRNAFRHAEAKQIEVELRYDERDLRLRVRDDGKGIDPKVLSQGGREGHFGMHGMRERGKLIGGKLTVWSGLDSGTEVELRIPAAHAYTSSPSSTWRSRLAEKFRGQSATTDSGAPIPILFAWCPSTINLLGDDVDIVGALRRNCFTRDSVVPVRHGAVTKRSYDVQQLKSEIAYVRCERHVARRPAPPRAPKSGSDRLCVADLGPGLVHRDVRGYAGSHRPRCRLSAALAARVAAGVDYGVPVRSIFRVAGKTHGRTLQRLTAQATRLASDDATAGAIGHFRRQFGLTTRAGVSLETPCRPTKSTYAKRRNT